MKKIYIFTLLLAFCSFCSEAFAFSEADSVIVSYGGNTSAFANAQGSGSRRQNGAAVCFKPVDIANYVGNYITDVHFYIGSSTQIDSVKVFVCSNLDEINLSSVATVKTNSWNQVRLTEPFMLTGDSIFIGYMLWGRDYPMSMFANTGASRSDNWKYNYSTKKWSNLTTTVGSDNDAFAIEGIVKGDNLPLNNVELITAALPAYVTLNKEYTITGWITNRGVSNIKSLEFEVSSPNQSSTYTLTGLDLASGKSQQYSLSGVKVKETGTFRVYSTVTKVNGMNDIDMSDNKASSKVTCQGEFVARNMLVEHFTSELCTGCPAFNKKLEAACENFPNAVQVAHHAGYFSDPWTVQESWDIFSAFCPQYRFNPVMMLDRTNMSSYGATSGYEGLNNPFINPDSKNQAEIERLLGIADGVPALAKIEVSNVFDYNHGVATVNISGESVLTMPDTAFVHLYVVVDSLASLTQSNGGEGFYYHRHVVRNIVTPIWGDCVKMEGGFNVNYEVAIPEGYDYEKTTFVAFLSAYHPTNLNNREVYNAAKCALDLTNAPNAITQLNAKSKLDFYVDNATQTITLQGDDVKAEAYSASGALISTSEGQALRVNHSGVVIVKLYAADGSTRVVKVVL